MSNLLKLDSNICEGLRLFNEGFYFECHEALETAWRAETGPTRELYQGILQAAVCYYHIVRTNYSGALKMCERSLNRLSKWPDVMLGIHVGQLRNDLASTAERLGGMIHNSNMENAEWRLKPIIYNHALCKNQKHNKKKTPLIRCDRCGSVMRSGNCKIICPNCGNRFDCSDLAIYYDELS
jgi:hypothetical protein